MDRQQLQDSIAGYLLRTKGTAPDIQAEYIMKMMPKFTTYETLVDWGPTALDDVVTESSDSYKKFQNAVVHDDCIEWNLDGSWTDTSQKYSAMELFELYKKDPSKFRLKKGYTRENVPAFM